MRSPYSLSSASAADSVADWSATFVGNTQRFLPVAGGSSQPRFGKEAMGDLIPLL